MVDKILRVVIGVFGMILGASLLSLFVNIGIIDLFRDGWINLAIYLGVSILFGIIFFSLSSRIIHKGRKITGLIVKEIEKFSVYDIAFSSIGLIVGLLIAFLLSQPIINLGIPYVGVISSIILYGFFGYLGVTIPHRKKEDIQSGIQNSISNIKRSSKDKIKISNKTSPKILDTSVIIDGRIADICKTGFVEGPLIIPQFVLEELQHIADSSDTLKRNRGRRGLDILNKIQKELDIEVIIYDKKIDDVEEVDSKLLKLAQMLKGKIITNDFNLNKVAEVQGIEVLNVNELANAVKPIVLPGEEMVVHVIKDGKEFNQGLAYLDDGTMIVVEGGKQYIGEKIDVIVTSVLQTSAGRMIFAKPKSLVDKAV
ncbi:MAG TPA: PIN/TRAM domain-containing protein [Tissierellaceae bacterium]